MMGLRPAYLVFMISVTSLVPGRHHCMSVHLLNGDPVQVALGQTLVLEAQVNKTPGHEISMVTWELQRDKQREKVAEYPKRNLKLDVSLDQQGMVLRVTKLNETGYGIYTVTVTDKNGKEYTARRTVKEAVTPPEASISLYCDVPLTRWDVPGFVWLVDGVDVSNNTSVLSADGRRLFLSAQKGLNYTCVVSSSQGTSVAQYITGVISAACDGLICSSWIWVLVTLPFAVCF
ncbi:uncharacterized protein [Paramormyrops kingsleyae]|uniref:Uncharacterized LOC111844495 n=2 Tax=Paramormyrops kingsleyae TaxID=1676925 RepID=A0A3B3R0J9_9TELE|nr:uncharacterized protein LOC111844495 [Paramormyrops kingsleyae]XP_023668777.1 uncharacterized protein LOC111844495 [Paramormyrops kingsleyae]